TGPDPDRSTGASAALSFASRPRTGRPHALSGQPRRSGASGAAARGRRRLSDASLGLASQAGAAESAPPPSDAALTHGETRALHYLPTNLSAREIAGEL